MFTQMLYAQGAKPQGAASMMPSLLMMGAIFAIFYFLLIRPQKMQQKKLQSAISTLKKGDKVLLADGIFAEYVSDKENGKIALVKIGEDTKIEVLKSRISSVLSDVPVQAPTKGKKEEKNSIKEEIKKVEEKDKK